MLSERSGTFVPTGESSRCPWMSVTGCRDMMGHHIPGLAPCGAGMAGRQWLPVLMCAVLPPAQCALMGLCHTED